MGLLLLIEDGWVTDLLRSLELRLQGVLNVEDHGVLVPHAVAALELNQSVRRLVHFDTTKEGLDIGG